MPLANNKTLAPVKRTVDKSDVIRSVEEILRNNQLLDDYIKDGLLRMAGEVAENISPFTNQRVEDARNELLKDVQENFTKMGDTVKETFTDLERENERRIQEAEAKMNQTLTLTLPSPETGAEQAQTQTQTKTLTGLFHKDFPKLLRLVNVGNPLVLTGPTQSGKSKSTQLAAEALGLRYYYHAFGPTQTETALAGFNSATGEFVYRSLYLAARYGGVWVGDEADVVRDAGVLIWMNNLISNGTTAFPIGRKSDMLRRFEESIGWVESDPLYEDIAGGSFPVHPDFKVLLTMNTYGEGGNMTYGARGHLDRSTLARFDFLYWGYDTDLEFRLAEQVAPGGDTVKWVRWGQAVRSAVIQERLDETVIISPSHLIRGAKNLAAGFTWDETTELSLLPGSVEIEARTRISSAARRYYYNLVGEHPPIEKYA